ncbi:BICP22 transcription factor [Bovine alphaherpesvirus 5]|nr:BICP22 transcription factor [Bovine alphaherpesvirus 5]QVY10607.1 BICP22 transcription factor [Bovine alphaherpesvirus 5]UHJ15490.1 BICP22 transcription factor [Bovine alphaherpesvirus 5]
MSHGQPCPTCDGSCRLCRSPDRVLPGPAPAQAGPRTRRRGPGAFCPEDWRPDAQRLAVDVNTLFCCIATGSAFVTADTRALRRALVGFFLLGHTGAVPTDACWEALLQLSPEQAGPLHRLLRAAAAAGPAARSLSPPARLPGPLFGAECDVSGSDSSSEDDYEDDYEDDEEAEGAAAVPSRQRRSRAASGPPSSSAASSRSSASSSSSSSSSSTSSTSSSSSSSSSSELFLFSISDGEDDVFFPEPGANGGGGSAAAGRDNPLLAGPAPRRVGRRRPAPDWRWSSGSSTASSPGPSPGGTRAPPRRRQRV